MRRVPATTFDTLCEPLTLWAAYRSYRSGKRRRPSVAAFDLDADIAVHTLSRALRAGTYAPASPTLRVIREPKVRVIAAPAMADRILHHALVDLLDPAFSASFVHDSFAWGTGKGPHRAVLRHLAFGRRYSWRLGLDVRRYFPSIDHDILCGLLYRRIREKRLRALVRQLTRHGGLVYRHPLTVAALGLAADPVPRGRGLSVGTHWSQWCGSVYLDGLDHFIKRDLKIPAYIRYMDDFVLFSNDRDQLGDAHLALGEWLASQRHLALKPCPAGVLSTREPVTFLGYRVSQGGVRPGPKLRRNLAKKLRAAQRRGEDAVRRTLTSYRGLWLW